MNSFREELAEILEYYDGYDMANAKDGKAYTIDQIIAVFLKRKPENITAKSMLLDWQQHEENGRAVGYNQSIDDWEGNIKK